jgi:hypothetical protein
MEVNKLVGGGVNGTIFLSMTVSIGLGFDGFGNPGDWLDDAAIAGTLDGPKHGFGVVVGLFQPASDQ